MFRLTPTALPVTPQNLPASLTPPWLARMLGRFRWLSNPSPRFAYRQRGQSGPTRQRSDLGPQSTQVHPCPSLDHPLAMGHRGRNTGTAHPRLPFPMSIHVDQPVPRYTLRYQGNFPAIDLQPMLVVPFQVDPAHGFVAHGEMVATEISQAATLGHSAALAPSWHDGSISPCLR